MLFYPNVKHKFVVDASPRSHLLDKAREIGHKEKFTLKSIPFSRKIVVDKV